ncbi:hypothetical protein NW757_011591 [Fusarium falciforme]|nr:hypothetical protein NW757_011591 [Fusarium falciforme]
MATLDFLKKALREKGTATSSTTPRLSDSQYLHGFSILARGSNAYQDFIIPQLAQLAPLVNSDSPISVPEIGPRPKSILGYLPEHLRKKIGKYSALEPNQLFDGTKKAREAVQWVYDAEKLLPLSAGVYGADLGPDPRDKTLAAWAFGPNRTRLAKLKRRLDPGNVLAYTCPFLEAPKQKLVILVTGESGSGKDYCADIWASVFVMSAIRARVVSISDEIKREYAAATGADLGRLLSDRAYKEEHRPELTEFFKEKLMKRPEPRKEHFLKAMKNVVDVDVGYDKFAEGAKRHLLPFFHEDLERLASMVPTIPDYPTPVDFRHVLNIASSPNGLSLCTSLFKTHFAGDWAKVDAIASCEVGGFLFASPLAQQLDKPLVPIRKAGKLPPPVVLVPKLSSHVSSLAERYSTEQGIEVNPDLISEGVSVVVVDDVLATGTTLCAVLQLLCKAGARVEDISVMIVAEFPYHGGRGFLQKHDFGSVNIQRLLVFGGA